MHNKRDLIKRYKNLMINKTNKIKVRLTDIKKAYPNGHAFF